MPLFLGFIGIMIGLITSNIIEDISKATPQEMFNLFLAASVFSFIVAIVSLILWIGERKPNAK